MTVSPIPERIDTLGLTQDIPKFTPWISPTAATEWTTFLSSELPSLTRVETHLPSSTVWKMEEVFSTVSQLETNTSIPTTCCVDNTNNTVLADMFASEQAPCQVRNI